MTKEQIYSLGNELFSFSQAEVDEYINKKQKNEATQEIERLRERFGDLPILERLEFRMRMMGL